MRGVSTRLREVGGGKDACSIQTLVPDKGRGIIDACMERAVQELMDGKQRRLRGKDELERLICRVENVSLPQ